MNRITLSIALLFFIILLLNAPFFSSDTETPQSTDTNEAWIPNYQAKNMQSKLYDKKGDINHMVFATKMEHYDMLGFTLFSDPEYTIYTEKSEQPWRINAIEGTLYGDDRIELEQNVKITSLNEEDFIQTIETSYIEVDLINKTVSSDQAVKIFGRDYVIASNGFHANLLTRKIELIDHVQTTYTRN